ncbi:carbohydrate ABC transporter permease [Paenibacillus eucommiae]|uniref:ABC-type sugar transport system permease subunit n=1 Tax=Paenibacillus eucommiae TaxID=1355755 RepID=A0ABS4ISW0_9BACL|nr:sugar ABC transporter permease [Paenibacillus eucommiae]MBP1990648.1 ABC-type sugar transport system permease subunit [Paenibacillus eucommiae]
MTANKFMRAFKKYRNPYLFISPFFLLFIVFQLFPMVWSFFISFTEWNGMGEAKQVGMKNYVTLYHDYMFWDAVKNTFIYWVSAILLIIPLALLISVLLNYRKLRAKTFFKSVTFFPYVCAAVAMGLIFKMMFDYNAGIINELFGFFGAAPVEWMTSISLSKIPVIVLNVWRNTPWFTMIILSGLLSIPEDYYESARIDGANSLQQFFKITLPSLGSILFFCFIILTVDSWNIFTEPFILKGPSTSNISMFQYMYENSFILFKFGYAAAIGYVLTMILFVLSILQFVLMRKQGEV